MQMVGVFLWFQHYDFIQVLFLNDAMPVCEIELQWVTTQAKRNVHDMFRWHTRAWLLGALSKEVRRRKCSNCLTPTITKQSNLIPWSSYLHLCVVSTCSPPLDIWWCLQISPNISKCLQPLPYLARKFEPGGNTWRLSQPPTEQSTAIFFSSVRLAGSHKLQSHTSAVLQFRN